MADIKVVVEPNKAELKKRLAKFKKENVQASEVLTKKKAGGVAIAGLLLLLIAKLISILDIIESIQNALSLAQKAYKKALQALEATANFFSRNREEQGTFDRAKGSFGASVDVGG